jgi:predicted nucleotidyltransferase
MSDFKKLQKVLTELNPYVVVVGSFARGTNDENSDIDLFVKRRPQEELDDDWYGELEEHYIDKVIEVFESNNLSWDSLFVSYVHTNDLSVQIEVSSLFRIPKDSEFKTIDVFGVKMLSAIDDKNLKNRM